MSKPKMYSSERVLEEFYKALADIREAYYQHSGTWETLDRIERCMYLEGKLLARDVLDPKRKRDWEQ
jgi:predicted polyphosphate/ATP-dependent NAD kinase